MEPVIRHLFVYGTLRPNLAKPEQRRLIAGFTVAGPATVPGLLYDLGLYPALVTGPGIVHGDLLVVPDDRHLVALDAYEECDGDDPLYRREPTRATRADGTTVDAWAYFYQHSIASASTIAGGDYSRITEAE